MWYNWYLICSWFVIHFATYVLLVCTASFGNTNFRKLTNCIVPSIALPPLHLEVDQAWPSLLKSLHHNNFNFSVFYHYVWVPGIFSNVDVKLIDTKFGGFILIFLKKLMVSVLFNWNIGKTFSWSFELDILCFCFLL